VDALADPSREDRWLTSGEQRRFPSAKSVTSHAASIRAGTPAEDAVKIYVGNLSHDVTEEDLRAAFEPFGAVESVTLVRDKRTGDPKGFGFVEMPDQANAGSAIAGLNGKELRGRALTVNEARARADGPRQ
jgi:RNA recognition motif-containing protein